MSRQKTKALNASVRTVKARERKLSDQTMQLSKTSNCRTTNRNPKRLRMDTDLTIKQNPPSFKISGLIVLCVFGFLLFGFTPQANAGDISSTDMLMINILRPICEVMYIGSQAIQHIIGPLSNLF